MTRGVLVYVVWFACLGVACVERPLEDAETGQTTSADAETTGTPTSGTSVASGNVGTGTEAGTATSMTPGPGTSTTAGPGTGDGTSTDCGFICDTTGVPEPEQCDVFAQDCPEGEKCAAYAEGGGSSWNASKCVPVMGSGQHGDACTTIGGGVSGLDDCAKGVMCWDVDVMNHGTCVALCTGTPDSPVCAVGLTCASSGDGVLHLCLPECDPLIQDCAGDDLCILIGDGFDCVLDASGDEGQALDPCEYANVCDKGLLCVAPESATECDPAAPGCCLPMCDLEDPETVCPGVGQSCVSLWEEGMAPPEHAHVGLCTLPI